ncbi:MAG: GNAT family N-acetyltransferase [Microbacterium sp.]|uniref:GNAT family N-acetyltransferase n=1 Tax=Microbacterium sp. TaxID=51671 RepID=UPI003A869232
MSTIITGLRLQPLHIPASMDDADAGDFAEMIAVRNRVYREIAGHDDHAITADELLPHYQSGRYETRLLWLVVLDGQIVGRVGVDLPLENDSKVAYFLIELLAEVHGRGIGSTAYTELVEPTARAHGRTVLQSWAEQPEAPGPRIAAPTDFGSVPADDRASRFYLRHGYRLEQVERCSAFDLCGAFDGVEQLVERAREASTDYRVVSWFAPTPPDFVARYGWMKSRMVTDAPAAGLEFDEEEWDAARVARHDENYTSSGRTLHVTAAEHIATGELCAFNELAIGKDRTEASHQEDTLVLKEHRGHRLGMLVKCANLLAWREIAPESPRVITYNAEENRPMLDINETIGFMPVSYVGAWKKVLDD